MTSVSEQIIANTNNAAITKATNSANSTTSTNSSSVSSQQFLNLMCMQLQYQDPTNPMDNSEMLAQEAQFSTLEQMEAISSSFSQFANVYQANSLMGQYVEITNSNGETENGFVDYINLSEKDGASVSVNGTLHPLSQITKVYPASEAVSDSISENTSSIKNGVNAISEGISNLANKISSYITKEAIEEKI